MSSKTKITDLQNLYIYGAGRRGIQCTEILLSEGITPDGILDCSPEKVGKDIQGVRIFDPTMLQELSKTVTVIIAVAKREAEIKEYLDRLNVKASINYLPYEKVIEFAGEKIAARLIEKLPVEHKAYSGKYRIFYDHQIYSMQKWGGISRYNYEIITRVVKNERFAVDFFEGVNFNRADFSNFQGFFNRYFGEKSEKELLPPVFFGANNLLQKQFVQDQEYDIIHTTYYNFPEDVRYKKLIITVHDLIEEKLGIDPEMSAKKKRIISAADGIIAVSENTKRDLIEYYKVKEEKIKVIHEANALSVTPSPDAPLSSEYFLFVGNRGDYKNYHVLAQAFADLDSKYELVFFGGGPLKPTEVDDLKELGIYDRVRQVAGDDQLLADYYHHAIAFVYPSKYEGFGLPILEAMHYGTPVISSNSSSLPEVGGDACLYFDPSSAEELCEKLKMVAFDGEVRKKLSDMGRERESSFTWDKGAMETADFYLQVLQGE